MSEKIAIVTGSNNGIGFSCVKLLAKSGKFKTVILTARTDEKGEEAMKKIKEEIPEHSQSVVYHQLDVSSDESVNNFTKWLIENYGRCDVLINNAGIGKDFNVSFLNSDINTIQETLNINTYGALRMCQKIVPLMIARNSGRVINVSSGMGGPLKDMNGGSVAYRFSKVSLNALTKIMNDELKDKNIFVNSICPGFVDTNMTASFGVKAPRTPDQGADTAVWLALIDDDQCPRGKFWRDRKEREF